MLRAYIRFLYHCDDVTSAENQYGRAGIWRRSLITLFDNTKTIGFSFTEHFVIIIFLLLLLLLLLLSSTRFKLFPKRFYGVIGQNCVGRHSAAQTSNTRYRSLVRKINNFFRRRRKHYFYVLRHSKISVPFVILITGRQCISRVVRDTRDE